MQWNMSRLMHVSHKVYSDNNVEDGSAQLIEFTAATRPAACVVLAVLLAPK